MTNSFSIPTQLTVPYLGLWRGLGDIIKKEIRVGGCGDTEFTLSTEQSSLLGSRKDDGRMTLEQLKGLLTIYYDIPGMIEDELAAIHHCKAQQKKLAAPFADGLVSQYRASGNSTAQAVCTEDNGYYAKEIRESRARIAELQDQKHWLELALCRLGKIDRTILELALMGNPKDRSHAFRRPPWKEIAGKVNYSESHTRERMRLALQQLLRFSEQEDCTHSPAIHSSNAVSSGTCHMVHSL